MLLADAEQAPVVDYYAVDRDRSALESWRRGLAPVSMASSFWLWRTLRDHRSARHSIME
jgi:hypothetical protein